MLIPPSLSENVVSRSFRARNGEIGVLLSDSGAFLDACESDEVAVLGWEAWIAHHRWDMSPIPVPAPGSWCGLIPVNDSDVLNVISVSGDLAAVRRQLEATNFADIIPAP